LSRRRLDEPVLGLAAALGTAIITLATLEGGHGTGTEDNEVLFLWVSLFAFWFFDLRHALLQLGLIGVADAVLLIDQHPSFTDGVTRWLISRTASATDRKSTRLNSSHDQISYAVFCLKKKKKLNARSK